MPKFYEIDFLEAGEKKSGDAIALRYGDLDEKILIHVVDGGYSNDGEKLRDHIRKYYGTEGYIDHVVLTHPDGDHAAGLSLILEEFDVGCLWMNRPWVHVDSLLPRFDYNYTREGLVARLRKDFPHTAALEKLAIERGIEICDAFQGQYIGHFVVLAPSWERYLDLVVESEKTPEEERSATIAGRVFQAAVAAARNVAALWGQENLKGDSEGTSRENEASVVQYAELCGHKILLTGDAGVEALTEALEFVHEIGVSTPGLTRFQVPHHGSRRNLSSAILDAWLGERVPKQPESGSFSAIVSANKSDADHPRKAVVRALMHRGARVVTTEGGGLWVSQNTPQREGWKTAIPLEYPTDMEE